MLASKSNRIIENRADLKFVEISGQELNQLAKKLSIALTELLRVEGGVFIGPASLLHYQILAQSLGLDPEKIAPEQRQAFVETKYANAGWLVNQGKKSLITGTSMTLSDLKGVKFSLLTGTAEKRKLDTATQKRLNNIYAGTWKFETE